MVEKSVSPYKMLGVIGIINIFMIFIGIWIMGSIPCKAVQKVYSGFCLEGEKYFSLKTMLKHLKNMIDADWKLVISLILYWLGLLLMNLSNVLIMYNLSPTHLLSSNMLGSILCVLIFGKGTKWEAVIGFFVIILGSLIYNENIIFNFWGLGDNCAYNIQRRANMEVSKISELLSKEGINIEDESERTEDEKNNDKSGIANESNDKSGIVNEI